MMDMLMADLDKEIQTMTVEEKDAQAEYEELMKTSAEKRSEDSRSLTGKEGEKADLEAQLQQLELEHKGTLKELYLKETSIKDLHLECDWLLGAYEVRKTARAGEVDALKKAKAVLSG